MTTPTPEPAPAAGPADPLGMARNCAALVDEVAGLQNHPDKMVRLEARIAGAGRDAYTSAVVGACMALVSLAGDVRRIADALAVPDCDPL